MGFRLPTFNLSVNIWRTLGAGGVYAAPDVSTIGNLAVGKRIFNDHLVVKGTFNAGTWMTLLLPPLTDIRAQWNNIQEDLVEVPAGTHRFYGVEAVDDIGKGFPNEHRYAIIRVVPSNFFFGFPTPVPLP